MSTRHVISLKTDFWPSYTYLTLEYKTESKNKKWDKSESKVVGSKCLA